MQKRQRKMTYIFSTILKQVISERSAPRSRWKAFLVCLGANQLRLRNSVPSNQRQKRKPRKQFWVWVAFDWNKSHFFRRALQLSSNMRMRERKMSKNWWRHSEHVCEPTFVGFVSVGDHSSLVEDSQPFFKKCHPSKPICDANLSSYRLWKNISRRQIGKLLTEANSHWNLMSFCLNVYSNVNPCLSIATGPCCKTSVRSLGFDKRCEFNEGAVLPRSKERPWNQLLQKDSWCQLFFSVVEKHEKTIFSVVDKPLKFHENIFCCWLWTWMTQVTLASQVACKSWSLRSLDWKSGRVWSWNQLASWVFSSCMYVSKLIGLCGCLFICIFSDWRFRLCVWWGLSPPTKLATNLSGRTAIRSCARGPFLAVALLDWPSTSSSATLVGVFGLRLAVKPPRALVLSRALCRPVTTIHPLHCGVLPVDDQCSSCGLLVLLCGLPRHQPGLCGGDLAGWGQGQGTFGSSTAVEPTHLLGGSSIFFWFNWTPITPGTPCCQREFVERWRDMLRNRSGQLGPASTVAETMGSLPATVADVVQSG